VLGHLKYLKVNKVFYRTRFNDKKLSMGELKVDLKKATIDVQVEKSGVYDLEVYKIEDGNGCVRNIEDGITSARISVLKNRPSVGFQTIGDVYILEGEQAELPISLSGRGPFEVKYLYKGEIIDRTIGGHSKSIKVNGPGLYEFIGVKDQVCEGVIDRKKVI
jgi:hypothetical protein